MLSTDGSRIDRMIRLAPLKSRAMMHSNVKHSMMVNARKSTLIPNQPVVAPSIYVATMLLFSSLWKLVMNSSDRSNALMVDVPDIVSWRKLKAGDFVVDYRRTV